MVSKGDGILRRHMESASWDDVGGLQSARQEFDRCIVRRIKFPEEDYSSDLEVDGGFLLFGPPGCGKTLIAKAVANEGGANLIHAKGSELGEEGVRRMFTRARSCAPCVLLFDEIGALTTKERVLNQLLIELDGATEGRKGVFVIGATNRPEAIDPAILRPGRLGKLMYVPLPSPKERGMILRALSRGKPIDPSVDLTAIACDGACENFSGADLSALANEAAMAALDDYLTLPRDDDEDKKTIRGDHFRRALERISPSVENQNRYYKSVSQKLLSS